MTGDRDDLSGNSRFPHEYHEAKMTSKLPSSLKDDGEDMQTLPARLHGLWSFAELSRY